MGRIPLLFVLVGFGAMLAGLPLLQLTSLCLPGGDNQQGNGNDVPTNMQAFSYASAASISDSPADSVTRVDEDLLAVAAMGRKAQALETENEPVVKGKDDAREISTNEAVAAASSFPGKFVIFYNAYVNPKSPNVSLQIMSEQMEQVYNSSHRNATVYYNILGHDITGNDKFCKKGMDCRKLRYVHTGDEVETLQDLYGHCLVHPNDTVIYLHNKGSFNSMGRNHAVRRLGTLSSTSEACRSMATTHVDKCNICVGKFHFLPNPHTQGNLWTAQCSYISTLVPPKEYELKRRTMFMDLKHNHKRLHKFGCFYTLLDGILLSRPYTGIYGKHLALGRYAMEAWVMSSPWSRPCHTIPGAMTGLNFRKWNATELWAGVSPTPIQYMEEMSTGWFQLYGRLYQYQTLYNDQIPPRDSWFWDRLPFTTVKEENAMNCTGLRYRAAKAKVLSAK